LKERQIINKKEDKKIMDNFEKVEKLVARANVSYEDAKNALDEANGDILDAMIILEKQGKVKQPEQTVFTTDPNQQTVYRDVPATIERSTKENAKGFFKTVGDAIKKGFQYTVDNSLKVERGGEMILNIPLWLTIIILLAAWHLLLIVMIISLFFGCKYSIVGKNESNEVNDILGQATEYAEKAKDAFSSDNTAASDAAANSPYRTENTAANTAAEAAAETTTTETASTVEGPVEGTVEGTVEDDTNK
jgi:hypothetical protein